MKSEMQEKWDELMLHLDEYGARADYFLECVRQRPDTTMVEFRYRVWEGYHMHITGSWLSGAFVWHRSKNKNINWQEIYKSWITKQEEN